MISAYEYDKYTTRRIVRDLNRNQKVVPPMYLPRSNDLHTELSLLPARARTLRAKGYSDCSLVVMGIRSTFDVGKFDSARAVAYADIGKAGDVILRLRMPNDGSQKTLTAQTWMPTVRAMERLLDIRNSMIEGIRHK